MKIVNIISHSGLMTITMFKIQNQGLSYIYYADRTGLEDRVFRIRGKAALQTPLPRTLHSIKQHPKVKTLKMVLSKQKLHGKRFIIVKV